MFFNHWASGGIDGKVGQQKSDVLSGGHRIVCLNESE